MRVVAHSFEPDDFVGGHVALDFTNTVTDRDSEVPVDWLDGYPRLIEWAQRAGLLEKPVAARLLGDGERSPREAAGALGRARRLREALHDACSALLARRPVPPDALAELESAWKRTATRGRLTSGAGQLRLAPDAETSGLDFPLDLVMFESLGLLAELDLYRTRACRGDRCGWLFIDTSKSGRRVWCDMATCGNAAKSQRFARAARKRRRDQR
jgi:predicted RNA-binding Zn ribbon-like protein